MLKRLFIAKMWDFEYNIVVNWKAYEISMEGKKVMSLSAKQIEDTKRELKENFDKAGVDVSKIAVDLGTSTDYINKLFRLDLINW